MINQNSPEELVSTVSQFEFEPIKGFPMLRWKGKRPFTSTQFYPAQLKEAYGKPGPDGWMNRIFWGDNLQVMSHLLKEFRGTLKVVYIDPPYDSRADYKKSVKVKGAEVRGDHGIFEEKQYSDIWVNDEYLQFMYERLILIRELLADDGSIFVHCDHRKNHHLRCILDEIFGPDKFVNEIIWRSSSFTGSSKTIANKFPVNHNTIYWYCKGKYIFNKPRLDYSEDYLKRFSNPDNDPNGPWQSVSLKTYSDETFERLKQEGALIAPQKKGAGWRYKFYLKDAKGKVLETLWYDDSIPGLYSQVYLSETADGKPCSTIWADINMENSMASGRTGYPTQKPRELISRIIQSASNPGDVVFDCFMGSGTTQEAALRLGRKFLGSDINSGSIKTSVNRIVRAMPEVPDSPGLQVLNINNYEFFRNPIEAAKLVLQALEVEQLSSGPFDGTKDDRVYKVLAVNRIASKADISQFISTLDFKKYEKRAQQASGQIVEKFSLVCFGHEPDLKAHFQKEFRYKADIEVIDILRDRKDLQFKRDSEARVTFKNNKVSVEQFYPMNLLHKLSLEKETVSEWRELVESVFIDWNYDGAVFEPSLIDIPDKDELVKGVYEAPADFGTIRVKITDLLSESLELEVERD